MKMYQKPTLEITAFTAKEAMAAGSIFNKVGVDESDPTNGPVTIYEIVSFGAAS